MATPTRKCIACPTRPRGRVYRYRMCRSCFFAYQAYSARAAKLLRPPPAEPSPPRVYSLYVDG